MIPISISVSIITDYLTNKAGLSDTDIVELQRSVDLQRTVFSVMYGYIPEESNDNFKSFSAIINEIANNSSQKLNYKRAMSII